jgi:hypothetical protein
MKRIMQAYPKIEWCLHFFCYDDTMYGNFKKDMPTALPPKK